ncbi:DUF4870 family protein [Vreelandella aquamarina]
MKKDDHDETPFEGEILSENLDSEKTPDTSMALVIYGFYLGGLIIGFTLLIGVVVAYVYKGKGPAWLDEHYRYQIRTFWIGLFYAILFSLLTLVLIGFPLLIALAVWLIIRCVKGIKGLQEKRAPSNVNSWLI